MKAILAQDTQTGIIRYARVRVPYQQQNQEIVHFLDFYKRGNKQQKALRYLTASLATMKIYLD
ncbi:MAG: hypothetical protein OXC61_09745 [Flavobacteriaceae bacterium]|nr:hypothetical protein [Flavobacteriaceae bacterium]